MWDDLHATPPLPSSPPDPPLPSFFRFLTLVAFHLFTHHPVDVLILEVGMGGRLDSTNVIPNPIVCGISHIGYDHMEVLGHTLQEIAREKGGIIKPSVPALTIPQTDVVLDTLRQCAVEEGSTLTLLPLLPPTIPLGLAGSHQLENATLAVGLSRHMLKRQAMIGGPGAEVGRVWEGVGEGDLPQEVKVGLRETTWAGRCQRFVDSEADNVTYFVDGAHTDASMKVACDWFQQQVHREGVHPPSTSPVVEDSADEWSLSSASASAYNVLLFNSGHVRNPFDLLQPVVAMGMTDPSCQFGHFLSCPFDHDRPHLMKTPSFEQLLTEQSPALQQLVTSHAPPPTLSSTPTWQHTLFRVFDLLVAWQRAQGSEARVVNSTPVMTYTPRFVWQSGSAQAVGNVRRMAARHPKVHFRVLVCGSLYLVGNVLEKLGHRIS